VARCRTAKQFEQFQGEKHLYPNLEWLATRSADPRELHLTFVGTILPIDDPFWQENQPGNLYNCKCDWQTTDKEVSVTPAKSVKPSPGLEGNPATTGEIFTEKHPYIAKGKKEIVNRGILEMPIEQTYYKVPTKNGELFVNVLHANDNRDGYNKLLKHIDLSNDLLNNGYKKILLLPEINVADIDLKPKFYSKHLQPPNPLKNAEAIIFDKSGKELLSEFKVITGTGRNLSRYFDDASEQAQYIFIKFKGNLKKGKMITKAFNTINKHKSIKQIIFIDADGQIIFDSFKNTKGKL
jgi:hypothetical protein